MHGRNAEAQERYQQRQQRENEAPRLAAEFPSLKSLKLNMTFLRGEGAAQSSHVRVIVIERAPAVFHVPCADRACRGGGHELTPIVMAALREKKTSFSGTAPCDGTTTAGLACTGELKFEATATYG